MTNGKIRIIGITDCGESVCAAAGRISTQSGTALEIFDRSKDAEKNARLIAKVTSSGHTSTVEHIFFNLAFENVSVVVEQFMIEFRLASFTVKSRRYVDFSDSGYYVPDFKDESDEAEYKSHMDSLFALYSELCENGIAKEDARFVLPYCFYSNFFCSLGGREMINVLRAMLFGRGRKIPEIYELGKKLLEDCKKAAPGIFSDFGSQYGKYTDTFTFDIPERDEPDGLRENVELLTLTPDCAERVAEFALIESLNLPSAEIKKIVSAPDKRKQIISQAVSLTRSRALEAVCCTVRFNDVSLSTLTHFTRHRIQSIGIPSLVSCKRDSYIIPESVKDHESLLDKYISAFDRTAALYEKMQAKGYTDGETVYCLLSGNTLDFVTTMNGRELLLFMKLRSCNRAQWEIRNFAVELLQKLRRKEPELFSFYGPSCYSTGVCPEGKLTCGKAAEVRKAFSELS